MKTFDVSSKEKEHLFSLVWLQKVTLSSSNISVCLCLGFRNVCIVFLCELVHVNREKKGRQRVHV